MTGFLQIVREKVPVILGGSQLEEPELLQGGARGEVRSLVGCSLVAA